MRLLVVLFVTALLAGCSEAEPTTAKDPLLDPDVDVKTSATTGALKVVVVDPSIVPIPDATIVISGQGLETTSDAAGAFGFSDLEPGVYFLEVDGPQHNKTTQSIEITAGEVTNTRVLLPVDLSPQPYEETLQFKGFVGLWLPGPSYVINLVQPMEETCICEWWVEPSSDPAGFVYEALWEASLEVPEFDQMSWEMDGYTDGSLGHQEGEYAPSPIHAHIPREIYAESADTWLARITPGISAGVYIDQAYDLYVSVFYVEAPPEGWSFIGV